MQPGQPSQTAYAAAAHRAAHQLVEGGNVFADPLAVAILGHPADMVRDSALAHPEIRGMRMFIAARSRFAEDTLATAVAGGVRQYVLLGAGLDTFGCRNPFEDQGLRVFEVDHPMTQEWKRQRLAEAGLTPKPSLTFAPVDFEQQTLPDGLAAAGFDFDAPAVFAWLGVVLYLTRETVMETLRFIAARPAGSQVAFDYGEPVSAYPPEDQPEQQSRLERMAAIGEPWITRFMPDEAAEFVKSAGFGELEDLGPAEISRRFFGRTRRDGPGGHLMRAGALKPCCDRMAYDLSQECDQHPNRFDCPDALIERRTDGYHGLIVHDGGDSSIRIAFCPWCGTALPWTPSHDTSGPG
jgi:methyltransferase (TIGR00027 family)